MKRPPLCILAIGGSDSGAGAGVQADARSIAALGGYALTVVTAVTAQNLHGVRAWQPVPARLIAAQIAAVWDDFPVAAVKIGLLPGEAAIRAVARELRRRGAGGSAPSKRTARDARTTVVRRGGFVPVVVDPVAASTSGTRFLSGSALKALKKELFPLATLVTPNWPEAELLTGARVHSARAAEAAAKLLAAAGPAAALVKGGHAPGAGSKITDILATAAGGVRAFSAQRIRTINTHGTGCVLSSAIAFHLACGAELAASVRLGRDFLLGALRKGRAVNWNGRGPAESGG